MSSLFSFLRGRARADGDPARDPAADLGMAPPSASPRAAPRAVAAGVLPGGSIPAVDLGPSVEALLDLFRSHLPPVPDSPDLPRSAVVLAELQHRSLGVGGRRGLRTAGLMDVAELRGGWLAGVIRFDLWGPTLDAVGGLAHQVQASLLAAGIELRRQGLLHLRLGASKDEALDSPVRWRRTLDYAVLYEYRFEDADGAASLIARIPVDDETDHGPPSHGRTEVRDAMVRWDDEGAPGLELEVGSHGPITIHALTIAAFLPAGGPAGEVVETIVRSGVTETTSSASLTEFLGRFALDPAGSLRLVFPPLPLEPGEVQAVREFQVGERRLEPPIVLGEEGDRFRIACSLAAFPPGNQSQVYLQARVR